MTWQASLFRPVLRLSALAALASLGRSAFACSACFGRSDSPLAAGMNAGIFALLFVIGCVLLSIAGFFVFLVRRSAKHFPTTDDAEATAAFIAVTGQSSGVVEAETIVHPACESASSTTARLDPQPTQTSSSQDERSHR